MALLRPPFCLLGQSLMIPLAKDTREAIGPFAEKVENRSLLFEKMVLSKSSLHDVERFDDAARFNVLRATHDGNLLLKEEQESSKRYANRGGKNADKAAYKARVAGALAGIRVADKALAQSRVRSTTRLMLDLEKSYDGRARTFVGSLGGRLLINMAGGVMENSGLSLDRITGLPVIPGSAVKGITRHQALWEIRRANDREQQIHLLRVTLAVFGFTPNDLGDRGDFLWAARGDRSLVDAAQQHLGSETSKGACSFLSAHPSNLESLEIVPEVLTPHFNNNLRPIFFPAVEAGATFAFAIIAQRSLPQDDLEVGTLLGQAEKWLKSALSEGGIGAKTGAGYGWFRIDPQAEELRREEMRQEEELAEIHKQHALEREAKKRRDEEQRLAEKARREALDPTERIAEDLAQLNDQEFNEFAKELPDKTGEEQKAFLQVLNSSAKKDRRKQWKKKKQDLWGKLSEVASTHEIELL